MSDKDKLTDLILKTPFEYSHDGKLPKGLKISIAKESGVRYFTVQRIWNKKLAADKEWKMVDLSDGRKNNGKETTHSEELLQQAIKDVPMKDRGAWRRLGNKIDVPKSTLFDYKKKDVME